jgi:hypothetical protein
MALPIDGTVPTSKGDLYVCPARFTSEIKSVHVSNESGVARTATLYVNLVGTSRPITPISMALDVAALAVSEAVFNLTQGQKIEGIASGSGVTFVISGVEKRNE